MKNARQLRLPYRRDPEHYFKHCLNQSSPVLLESTSDNLSNSELGIDIVSANPVQRFEAHTLDPYHDARTLALACKEYLTDDLRLPEQVPFCAGLIGLISYSGAAQASQKKASQTEKAEEKSEQSLLTEKKSALKAVPAVLVGVYQWAIVINHRDQSCFLMADPKLAEEQWQKLCKLFSASETRSVSRTSDGDISSNPKAFKLTSQWECQTSEHDYQRQFAAVAQYILEGDSYQVNLSREFSASYQGCEWQAYTTLRAAIPAPFSGFFKTENFQLASFSPERFVRINNGKIRTQPIKGTRRRHPDPKEDLTIAQTLEHSRKDRAENLMIVDLMRNDLGKHCKTGSIKAYPLFEIQTFSNVHHLVSTVEGELTDSSLEGVLHCFLDSLPGGSVTGAPKIRSMEIIDELEPHDRGTYCGNLFYLTANGTMESNILIRSALFVDENARGDDNTADSQQVTNDTGKRVYCCGGGGLVADSQPAKEYDESYYKISNILDTLSEI